MAESAPSKAGGGEVHPAVGRLGLWLGPLAFVALLAWPGLPLDGMQRRVAAVTAWTAVWWVSAAAPIGATSLLPAALLPLTGALGAREVAPMYMHDLVLLFVGAFIVSLGLERWGVHRRMALGLVEVVGTSPRRLVFGFMLTAAFLSCWVNNTSTTLLMLPIAMAVVGSVEGERGTGRSPFALSLLLGTAYSASVGGMATPVGTAPNQVFLGQFRERFPDAPEISFGQWPLAWGPLVVLYLPLGWLVLTRGALRVPAGSGGSAARETIRRAREALGPMSTAEKRMAAVFAATAFLWVTRADLELGSLSIPGWVGLLLPSSIEAPERFVTDATVASAMGILCFLVPAGERGERLMDWPTAARLPWEVLLLIGGGFAIAGAFQASGLDRLFGSVLGPLFEGHSPWVVVLCVVVFMAALTEVTSNTATTAVLLPVVGQAAVSAGLSPLVTMLPATIAASAAFMLPVATPPNAVVFSSRFVPAPTMARVGLWLNLTLSLLVLLVFQLWVRRVLAIGPELPPWAGG